MRCRSLLVLPLVTLVLGGCGYLRDRGRDAADIFTATLGYGLGAKAQVGPLNVGVIGAKDWAGLRGGGAGINPADGWSGVDLELFVVGLGGMTEFPVALARSKGFKAQNVIFGVADYDCPEGREPLLGAYYTQVEVVVAVGGGLRLGVNPGELVDFLVGLVGLDLYRDDGVAPIEDSGAALKPAQDPKQETLSKPFGDDPFGL